MLLVAGTHDSCSALTLFKHDQFIETELVDQVRRVRGHDDLRTSCGRQFLLDLFEQFDQRHEQPEVEMVLRLLNEQQGEARSGGL